MSNPHTYLYQINVTRDCNLRCTHCYIHSDTKANSKEMPPEKFLDIIQGIHDHMLENVHKEAEIHIIGGEPTMLGLEFFKNYIPKAREILKGKPFIYKLMLVSNLIHEDILEISKLFDAVSTSYEPETRFVSRTGKPKPKLEEKWLDSVFALKEAGIDLSMTTAMTKPVLNYGAENLLEMLYSKGLKQIHFGFFIPEGDGLDNTFVNDDTLENYVSGAGCGQIIGTDKMKKSKDSIFPEFEETSDFLIDVTNWYLKKRKEDPDVYINPVESMLSSLSKRSPLEDIVCPIISGSMDINWDGNVATCLEAGGSKNPNFLGNIFEVEIKDIVKKPKFMKEVVKASKPHKGCVSCEYYTMCRGGCSVLARWWDVDNDPDCPGFKKYIKYLDSLLSQGVKARY